MANYTRVRKLILRLSHMTRQLVEYRYDLVVHREIDQFFYMQREEELRVLLEEVEKAADQLADIKSKIDSKYQQAYCRWCRDVRWISKYKEAL